MLIKLVLDADRRDIALKRNAYYSNPAVIDDSMICEKKPLIKLAKPLENADAHLTRNIRNSYFDKKKRTAPVIDVKDNVHLEISKHSQPIEEAKEIENSKCLII